MIKSKLEMFLDEISGVCIYFQRIRPLESLDKDDGIAIGYDFLHGCHSAREMVKRVDHIMHENMALRELGAELPWLRTLLKEGESV